MNCPQCQTPNEPNARFCRKCATPMTQAAPGPSGWAPSALGGQPPLPTGAQTFGAPTAGGGMRPGLAPRQSPRFEGWLEGYVIFDGEVLEQFNWRVNSGTRLHVAVIADAQVQAGGCINVTTVYGAGNLLVHFHEHQRAQAEHLAQLIRSARRR